MKIRSLDELTDKIDQNLAKRKKEINYLYFLSQKDDRNRNHAIRTGIVLLYSHWEGFIKNAGEFYLLYIKTQGIKFQDLQPNFTAFKFKNILQDLKKTDSNNFHYNVYKDLIDVLDKKANFDEQKINTNSNLNSSELSGILLMLGFDANTYELKHNLIDEQLVKNRNQIAHGDLIILSFELFDQLKISILEIMNDFKLNILNAAAKKDYLSKKYSA